MTQREAVHVTAAFHITSPLDAEGFHAHGENVMDALIDLEQNGSHADSDVATDAGERTITVGLLLFTDDLSVPELEDAMRRAMIIIRTAAHTAGASTPGWPSSDELRIHYEAPRVEIQPALV